MITYKEFEVINTMLKAGSSIVDIPKFVYSNVHYYAFKSQNEISEVVDSLEKKEYIQGGW